MHNMLEDDKTRLGFANGESDSSILDERLEAMIANEVKLIEEYGDDYFKSGTGKILGRFQRGLGASGKGQRTFTNMRTANNQMGNMYTNEELANMLNTGFENAGLENRFKLSEDLRTREKKAEGKLVGDQKKLDVDGDGNIDADDFTKLREQKQEGGSMDDQMQMAMNQPMLPDEEMEDNYLDFIIDEALDEEEEDMLMSKLEQDEQLSMLFDKVLEVASEFAGSGPVEGPGSGVSDSIPARLSDGEFVFTAKATEQIGADELMRMMKDAEADADRQGIEERKTMAHGGPHNEDRMQQETDQFGRPLDVDLTRDEIEKNMMLVNPRYQ